MSTRLSADALQRALGIPDLTDPAQGIHAIQLLVDEIERAICARWNVPVRRERAHPVVSIRENYDRLRISRDAVARDVRYTRYVDDRTVLRTHTTAMVPQALDRLAADPPVDVVLSCPGICYRRDSIGRHHTGEPHQLDVWRIKTIEPELTRDDLMELIAVVVHAATGPRPWRTIETGHPYTVGGVQIDVHDGRDWIEVGECGVALPDVLSDAGLPVPPTSGLAMGLGLDRLLMLRKGLDDIRLIRSHDPRIASQMRDLEPYRPVSFMPPVKRDLSIAVADDVDEEILGDRIRRALGDDWVSVESVSVLNETPCEELPEAARERLGIVSGQKNSLVRVILRDLERTLTDEEANVVRDRIYEAIHQGSVWAWASGRRPSKGGDVERDGESS